MQKHKILLLQACLFTMHLSAQENWTLRQCVDYAIENNIELDQKYNKVNKQSINVLESKAGFLPDLYAGTSLSLGFGRSIDDNTNAITFDQTLGNDYRLQSSLNLFQGLTNLNNVSYQKHLLSAIKEEAEYAKNRLVFDVLSAYYTLYYTRGLEKVAKTQVSLAEIQFNRMQKLVEVGKESQLTAQELKSQWANDKLSLTLAENNVRNKILELKQLLRFSANKKINISTIPLASLVIKPLPNIDSVFNIAKIQLPEIKMQEYLLSASQKNMAISKGNISPRLYLQAGIGTGYFDSDSLAFSRQLINKQNQWIRIGIQIPIFGRAATYSQIKRKQIAIKDQELKLEQRKENLYSEIWKAMDDLQSAQNEYEASVELNKMSKLTFESISKKIEKGLSSATDFEAAKQRLALSEAALLKSKLIFMMRNQMLEFYLSGNWGHL